MAIRIAFIADTHLDQRYRWDETIAAWHRLVYDLYQTRPDLIIGLGDMVGRDSPHDPTTFEDLSYAYFVRQFAGIARFWDENGNHERFDERASWETLVEGDQIRHFTAPAHVVTHDVETLMVPYMAVGWWCGKENPDTELATRKLQEWVENELKGPRNLPRVLAMHYPVLGAHAGGWEQQRGNDIVLDPEWLKSLPVDYVAIGHIHTRQEFYPGSLVPQSRTETGAHGYDLVTITEAREVIREFRPIQSWEYVNLEAEVDQHGQLQMDEMHTLGAWTGGPVDCQVKVLVAPGAVVPGELIRARLPKDWTVSIKTISPESTERVAPEIAQLHSDEDRLSFLMQRRGLEEPEQVVMRDRYNRVRA